MTVIEHVVEKVKQAKLIDNVVVAAPEEMPAVFFRADFFYDHEIPENDVLRRVLTCALAHQADIVVRITADCPLVQPKLIDHCIEALIDEQIEYVTTRPHYPDGLDVEAMTVSALRITEWFAKEPYDREHVTSFMRDCSFFRRAYLHPPVPPKGDVKFSLDTVDDLKVVRKIYESGEQDNSFNRWYRLFR